MTTAETHYRTHLGPVYSWMLGDLDAAFARGAAEIDDLPLPASGGTAVDLGAGLGLHALGLAKRGFDVVAIDSCQSLLDELQSRARSLRIAVHHADLVDFRRFFPGQAQVIVCMGDTLTHLPALPAVESLQYGDHHVTVRDLLHERADGRWRQTVSSYPKLRLAPEWVMSKLSELGLRVTRDATPSGMARIVATKN